MDSLKQSRFLSEPRSRVVARMHRWARARQGEDTLPLTLASRRIYILPTKAGIGASALLFAMLLAGMNYGNSLALFLCFTLCGVTLVSMHECHRTLAGLKLLRAEADNTFAGRTGDVLLHFENCESRIRSELDVRTGSSPATEFDLLGAEVRAVRMAFQAGQRGRQRLERLRLSTQAPLGLFRAWAWVHLPLEAIIYPSPYGTRPLPPRRGEPLGGHRSASDDGEEEWGWLRSFQDSDPPRSVAWKAYARGAPLMVAQYDAPAGLHRQLDFESVPSGSLEQKLSQLTQWALECERLGESYALQIPKLSLPAGHGVAHRRACLAALALYGL